MKTLSVIVPARNASVILSDSLNHCLQTLNGYFSERFELILVINSSSSAERERMLEMAQQLARKYQEFSYLDVTGKKGKGWALSRGAVRTKSDFIGFVDIDLPYDLEFFARAYGQINAGIELVTGKRSHRQRISFRSFVSLLLNLYARSVLGIKSSDTQSGIKLMTRRLARQVFTKEVCPGYLFDLEIFLHAKVCQLEHRELTLHQSQIGAATNLHFLLQAPQLIYWLVKITARRFRGYYKPAREDSGEVGLHSCLVNDISS